MQNDYACAYILNLRAIKIMGSRRDNFPQSVIYILIKRSGGKCCNCGAATFGPHTGRQDKYQNIGQAAHIAAAAPGGPRYDPKMAPEQRMSATNGVWLCSNCHSLVDRDTEQYTLKRLWQIKREGEERARQEVGVASVGPGVDRVDDTADTLQTAVSATTIVEIRKAKASLVLHHGHNVRRDEAEKVIEDVSFINFEVDTYHPQVGWELASLFSKISSYCTDAEINLEVIRQFHFILERFDIHWGQQEVELVANTLYAMTGTFKSSVYRSAVAQLKDLSRNKQLMARKLHSIPLECLKDLQSGKNKRKKIIDEDDIDYQGKEQQGGVLSADSMECSGGGKDFVDYMVELAEAGDDKTPQLEAQLKDMGYEPHII